MKSQNTSYHTQHAHNDRQSASPVFRYQIWLLAGVFFSLLLLGQFSTSQAKSAQQTIPPGLRTEVRGPYVMTDDTITVAETEFSITDQTRIDKRVLPPGESADDVWARVQAVQQDGVLVATRIKFIKLQPFLRIRDTLLSYEEQCAESPGELELLSGIIVTCDSSTKITGKLHETTKHQRVQIKATTDLYALHIVGKALPPPVSCRQLVGEISEIAEGDGGEAEIWTIGSHEVGITDANQIDTTKGNPGIGALVKISAYDCTENTSSTLIGPQVIVLRAAKPGKPEDRGKPDKHNEQDKPDEGDGSPEDDVSEEEDGSDGEEGKSNKPEKPEKPDKPDKPDKPGKP